MLNRRDLICTGATSMCAAVLVAPRASATQPGLRTSFTPGEIWLDTSKKPIQAHGGSMLHWDGTFYWYGENKEKTDGKNGIWTWGIRAYSSKDLYNWKDEGLIIPPATDDPASPLYPKRVIDRPHIVFNRATRKFVCWIKTIEADVQCRTVLTADSILGPYTVIHHGIHPAGMGAGDFDVVVSPDDGKAYMYFERVHTEMICADLTEDYANFTGYYSTHFPRHHPPFVREGIGYFRRGGKHYITSSGTTGYFPNPSEVAVADSYHGPFTLIGDLHPSDRTRTSFNSQISCIFKHPAKQDLYIAMADRWMGPLSGPDFEDGTRSRLVREAFDKKFGPSKEPLSPELAKVFGDGYFHMNTSQSRYVWLPIRFYGDRPAIEWRSEWRLDEFD